jgi:Tfp pilus assembly protein PilO
VLLAVLVSALLGAALVFAVIMPMARAATTASAEAAGLRGKLASAEAVYRQGPSVRQEIAKLTTVAKELSRPDRDVGPDMIRQIDQLTKDLGLRLLNVRPGQPERVGQCGKYTASFEVESDLERIARMLWELEQGPSPLWVEGVEVNAQSGGASGLRATIGVAVYTLKARGEQRAG